MQMRKGKSPRSAFRPTINPEDMFPTGSPGSSCCGLRNSRAQGLRTELFPTHSEQSLLLIRLLGVGRGATLSSTANAHHHLHNLLQPVMFSSRRNSSWLMPLGLSYPSCKMVIISSISVGLLISVTDWESFSYVFYLKKTLY